MQRYTTLLVSMIALLLAGPLACGPKCPEIKQAMSESELAEDDANRVNAFVGRRKAVMQEAGGGDKNPLEMQRLKFSVTAYELAIQIQIRIIELASNSDLYQENLDTIDEARCFFDDILAEKLINKEDVSVSDRIGKKIQEKHVLFGRLFKNEGAPSSYELKEFYEKGIKLKKPAAEEDEDDEDDEDEEEEEDEGEGDEDDELDDDF
ncbi:MAG: hypothetical protein QNJ97_16670 [Myxococcota bacterium]|nr:hypothetical protein [Myxococcota bacterium]